MPGNHAYQVKSIQGFEVKIVLFRCTISKESENNYKTGMVIGLKCH